MGVRVLLAAFSLVLLLHILLSSAVDPSECKAVWIFKVPCTKPESAMVEQVKALSTYKCFDSEEQCAYEIIKEMPSYLEIKHTYLSRQKTSNLNFTFKPPASPSFCSMRGLATAADTNPYCLLHNLVNGSGLSQVPGYMEICNKGLCPPVELATCNKGL